MSLSGAPCECVVSKWLFNHTVHYILHICTSSLGIVNYVIYKQTIHRSTDFKQGGKEE